uniref:Uncharacterized protein n=1 Tax=Glossina brevipalpis TaxID=37001 RepID=A0A1A9WTJ8_9MUSC
MKIVENTHSIPCMGLLQKRMSNSVTACGCVLAPARIPSGTASGFPGRPGGAAGDSLPSVKYSFGNSIISPKTLAVPSIFLGFSVTAAATVLIASKRPGSRATSKINAHTMSGPSTGLPSNSGNPNTTKTLSEQNKDIIEKRHIHIKESFIGRHAPLIKFSLHDSLATAETALRDER